MQTVRLDMSLFVGGFALTICAPLSERLSDFLFTEPPPAVVEEVERLQAGSDASLFTDVLGEPGYRRATPEWGDEDVGSAIAEWAWAKEEEFFVRAVVDEGHQVLGFSVTSLGVEFSPSIPLVAPPDPGAAALRTSAVRDVRAAAGGGQVGAQHVDGPGASGAWDYMEVFYFPAPTYLHLAVGTGSGSAGRGDGGAPIRMGCAENIARALAVWPLDELADEMADAPVTTFSVFSDSDEVVVDMLLREPTLADIASADRT